MRVNVYGFQVLGSPKATGESAKDLITKNNGVQDDPKPPDDSGVVPKPNIVVGGSIPSREIVSLFDGKLTKSSGASCVPKKRRRKKKTRFVQFSFVATFHLVHLAKIKIQIV